MLDYHALEYHALFFSKKNQVKIPLVEEKGTENNFTETQILH